MLAGKISSILDGNVNDEISVDLGGAYVITSIITEKLEENLELTVRKEVSPIVKSSSVILAVD